MKKVFFFTACIVSSLTAYTQHEHTLHFMPDIGQFNYTNPALSPNYKVTIGLPLISSNYVSLSNSGFRYKDLVTYNEENKALYLTLNNFVDNLAPQNYAQANASIDLFNLTFKANPRLFLSFNVTVRSYKRLMYPRNMFDFVVKGNGNLLGQTLSLSPKMESASYLEMGFGGSYRINQKLTIGSRFKILRGIENISTERSDLNLTTDRENYNIHLQAGLSVLTSNINRIRKENIDGSNALDKLKEKGMEYIANEGFAVDLGATYKFNDRVTVGLSVLDIGAINWEQDTYEYFMDPATAQYTLKGAEIKELLEGGAGPFEAAADSIEANFVFEEGTTGDYKRSLPAKSYLSGSYKLSRTVTSGALIFMEKFKQRWNGGFSLNISKELGSRMGASLSYSMMNRSYQNFGAGLSFNFAPLQLYVVSDNLVNAAYHGITKGVLNDYINNVKSINFRFGLNFVFGREKGPVGQYVK